MKLRAPSSRLWRSAAARRDESRLGARAGNQSAHGFGHMRQHAAPCISTSGSAVPPDIGTSGIQAWWLDAGLFSLGTRPTSRDRFRLLDRRARGRWWRASRRGALDLVDGRGLGHRLAGNRRAAMRLRPALSTVWQAAYRADRWPARQRPAASRSWGLRPRNRLRSSRSRSRIDIRESLIWDMVLQARLAGGLTGGPAEPKTVPPYPPRISNRRTGAYRCKRWSRRGRRHESQQEQDGMGQQDRPFRKADRGGDRGWRHRRAFAGAGAEACARAEAYAIQVLADPALASPPRQDKARAYAPVAAAAPATCWRCWASGKRPLPAKLCRDDRNGGDRQPPPRHSAPDLPLLRRRRRTRRSFAHMSRTVRCSTRCWPTGQERMSCCANAVADSHLRGAGTTSTLRSRGRRAVAAGS